QGFAPPATSVTLNRTQAPIAGYLETGDPYQLRTAQAVIDTSYWVFKNSWPRMAIGRDACFTGGAMLLYRYFADDQYRALVHDVALNVALSQRADGSFGDQGGGAGIHGWGGYITKPWMALLALNGVLDYLEFFPDEPRLWEAVRKFAEWLMAERLDRDGARGW